MVPDVLQCHSSTEIETESTKIGVLITQPGFHLPGFVYLAPLTIITIGVPGIYSALVPRQDH